MLKLRVIRIITSSITNQFGPERANSLEGQSTWIVGEKFVNLKNLNISSISNLNSAVIVRRILHVQNCVYAKISENWKAN